MDSSITRFTAQSKLFAIGCDAIWDNLRRAADHRNQVFTALEPVMERGDEAGAYFIFAFELNERVTQMTVHIEDIQAAARIERQIDGAVQDSSTQEFVIPDRIELGP